MIAERYEVYSVDSMNYTKFEFLTGDFLDACDTLDERMDMLGSHYFANLICLEVFPVVDGKCSEVRDERFSRLLHEVALFLHAERTAYCDEVPVEAK